MCVALSRFRLELDRKFAKCAGMGAEVGKGSEALLGVLQTAGHCVKPCTPAPGNFQPLGALAGKAQEGYDDFMGTVWRNYYSARNAAGEPGGLDACFAALRSCKQQSCSKGLLAPLCSMGAVQQASPGCPTR